MNDITYSINDNTENLLISPTPQIASTNLNTIQNYGIDDFDLKTETDKFQLIDKNLQAQILTFIHDSQLLYKQFNIDYKIYKADYKKFKTDFQRYNPIKNINKIANILQSMYLEGLPFQFNDNKFESAFEHFVDSTKKETNIQINERESAKEKYINEQLKKTDNIFVEFFDNFFNFNGRFGHKYEQEQRRKKLAKKFDENPDQIISQMLLSEQQNNNGLFKRLINFFKPNNTEEEGLTGDQQRLQQNPINTQNNIDTNNEIVSFKKRDSNLILNNSEQNLKNINRNNKNILLMLINKNVEIIKTLISSSKNKFKLNSNVKELNKLFGQNKNIQKILQDILKAHNISNGFLKNIQFSLQTQLKLELAKHNAAMRNKSAFDDNDLLNTKLLQNGGRKRCWYVGTVIYNII